MEVLRSSRIDAAGKYEPRKPKKNNNKKRENKNTKEVKTLATTLVDFTI
jgi:hypothetical protein